MGAGEEYALKLAEFASGHVLNPDSIDPHVLTRCNPKHARLWTSSLVRTIRTARHINHDVQEDGWVTMRPRVWRNLDEIYAGIFDGLTYKEIQERAPDEFAQRQQNKLGYRYPRGESYLDVIARLEPLVHEIERQRDPVMIVGLPWSPVASRGLPWSPVVSRGLPWSPVVSRGLPWSPVASRCSCSCSGSCSCSCSPGLPC